MSDKHASAHARVTEDGAPAVSKVKREKVPIGWREWITLPELGGMRVKAKIDTGARTAALHAWNIEIVRKGKHARVRFDVYPLQKGASLMFSCEAKLVAERMIRSSNGQTELRPIIRTVAELGEHRWRLDISLTRRDEMGFRMLLGRASIRSRFLVDAGRSYLLSSNA